MADDVNYPIILGVYSLRKVSEIGSGVTMVDHENVTFWYARQMGETRTEIQPLATSGLPSGMVKPMAAKDFLKTYTPEPLYYSQHPVAVVDSLAAKMFDGDESVALGSLDDGELAALKVIMVDPLVFPDHAKADYDQVNQELMALIKKVLGALLCRDAEARFEHCVRFNSYGVTLRKDGHLDESLGYFSKAIELHGSDENVYFNMARVYFDKGNMDECTKVLGQALNLNPEFKEAGKFARYVAKIESASA